MALHFSGWNAMPHFFSHATRLLNLSCRMSVVLLLDVSVQDAVIYEEPYLGLDTVWEIMYEDRE